MSDAASAPKGGTKDSGPKIEPFVVWLGKHQKGTVDTELTANLRQLVEMVQETGKKGSLTLAIEVKPDGESRVIVTEKITAKLPEHTRRDAVYYVDPALNLVRDPPGQGNLLKLNRSGDPAESDGDE